MSSAALSPLLRSLLSQSEREHEGPLAQPPEAARPLPALHVALVTPAPSGALPLPYVRALLATLEAASAAGVRVTPLFAAPAGGGGPERARNALVAQALADASVTHVLSVDADVAWRPADVLRMLRSAHDVVGAVPPSPAYRWGRAAAPGTLSSLTAAAGAQAHLRSLPATEVVRHHLVDYEFAPPPSGGLKLVAGVAEVAALPAAFLLLSRAALTRLAAARPEGRYEEAPPGGTGSAPVHALFEAGVAGGLWEGEGEALCRRWRVACGGRVHADFAAELQRSGMEEYAGRALSVLRFGG